MNFSKSLGETFVKFNDLQTISKKKSKKRFRAVPSQI